MPSDPNSKLNDSSSQLEQKWLRQIQDAAPDVFMSDTPDISETSPPSVTFVRVPDLSEQNRRLSGTEDHADDAENSAETKPAQASSPQHTTRVRDAEALIRPLPVGSVEVAKQISRSVDAPISDLPVATLSIDSKINSELSEKPSDWMGEPSGQNDDKDRSSAKSTAVDVDKESIRNLADQILERFPIGAPTALLFAGAGDLAQVDEACAQIAKELSERKIGKILLIDSDFEKSRLTDACDTKNSEGLRNILVSQTNWKMLIIDEGTTPMDFLPVGNEDLKFWQKAVEKKAQLISDMKQDYQFICISVGDSHSDAASFWSDVCDGSFLIVSMEKTNRTLAQSSVDQLRCNGARVLGCIVVDHKTS